MIGEISIEYPRDNRAGVYLHPMPISSTRTPEERECNLHKPRHIRQHEIYPAAQKGAVFGKGKTDDIVMVLLFKSGDQFR